MRVPEDVSVVGFDDASSRLARLQPHDIPSAGESMVAETVSTLIDRIEARSTAPRRVKIDGTLDRPQVDPQPDS